MGRPPIGKTPMAGLRLSAAKRRQIEDWAAQRDDRPSFSEAVRRLIDRGLLSGDDAEGEN